MANTTQPQEAPYQDDPSQPLSEQEAEHAPSVERPSVHIRHLTLASVSLALASFILGIALLVLIGIGEQHHSYTPRGFLGLIGWLIFVIILTILVSSLNAYRLRHGRPLPLPINLFLDFIIVIVAIPTSVPSLLSLAEDLSRGCENYWYYHDYCEPVELARDIVGIVTLSLVLIFGIIHLVLFVIRLRAAYLTKFWKGSSKGPWNTWKLPTGQVTVEFSLKLYRKAEATVGQQEAQAETQAEPQVEPERESLV